MRLKKEIESHNQIRANLNKIIPLALCHQQ